MRCECGKEITNVPERLRGITKWVCKECGRNIDTRGVIVFSTSGLKDSGADIKQAA